LQKLNPSQSFSLYDDGDDVEENEDEYDDDLGDYPPDMGLNNDLGLRHILSTLMNMTY
jgi:hypothetical protein